MDKACLKKLHDVQLEILDAIAQICQNHTLTYYLVGGTLLGAVRHQGFIPWDDDLDIAMPREDFEKFLNIAQEELPEQYFLQTEKTDSHYSHIFGKIRKNNTLFLEAGDAHVDMHHGIFVDIFPLDSGEMPIKKLRLKKKAFRILNDGLHFSDRRTKCNYCKKLIYKTIGKFPSLSRNIRNRCLKGNGDYYVNYGSQYGLKQQVIEKSHYNPPILLPFEGRLYSAPKDYDYILRKIYGDSYMELPPKEKRTTHNPMRLSFDTNGPDEDIREQMKKYKIGYTTGVFDMFHVGHLNILKSAKEQCEYLIVGVSTDELVQTYKNKTPIIPYEDRKAIVESIRYVDTVVSQNTMDKLEAWNELHFDAIFHGDDWKGSALYNDIAQKLNSVGCELVFLPHTDGVSSTMLQQVIQKSSGSKK